MVRKTTTAQADSHIETLMDMRATPSTIDDRWTAASSVKASYSPSIGAAYAIAAATDLAARDEVAVTLLVGVDDDYDVIAEEAECECHIERIRAESA